jgi:hypothetical protein
VQSVNHWGTFQEACQTHADCKDLTGGDNLYCTDHRWDFTSDGRAHTVGKACYQWERNVCYDGVDTPSWAFVNDKYGLMNFSYYSQTWCVDDDSTRETAASSDDGEGRRFEGMGIVAEME